MTFLKLYIFFLVLTSFTDSCENVWTPCLELHCRSKFNDAEKFLTDQCANLCDIIRLYFESLPRLGGFILYICVYWVSSIFTMYIVNNYFYLVVSHESVKLETIFTGNGRSDKNKELPVRVTDVIKKIPRINVQLFEIANALPVEIALRLRVHPLILL